MRLTQTLTALALAATAAPAALAAEKSYGFFENPTNWALIGLIVFLGILVYLKVPAMLTKSLDDRSAAIVAELDNARKLHEEAQRILAETERRQQTAEAEADAIIKLAKKEAAELIEEARKDLADRMARREQMAEARIARAEQDAVRDVRAAATDLATRAAEQVLKDTAKGAGEFTRSLDEIGKAL